MAETNFGCVKRWMDNVGQDVPAGPIVPNASIMELRQNLIEEESEETVEAIKELVAYGVDSGKIDTDNGNADSMDAESLVSVVKELADVLVVTYGAFVAIGVDADKAMNIVMKNNFGKVEKGTFREDGKLVVDAETKAQLKAKVIESLTELLSHGS